MLGTVRMPHTDAELVELLGAMIDEDLVETGAAIPTPMRDRLTGRFAAHPSLEYLSADISGAVIPINEHMDQPEPEQVEAEDVDARPTVVTRVESALAYGQLKGKPVMVESMPVEVTVDVRNLPLDWIRDDRDALWLVVGDRKLEGFVGTGEFSFDIDDARELLRETANRQAKEANVRVKELDFDLEVGRPLGGEQTVRITGVADGGYRFVGARVTVVATIVLRNDSGKATVTDLTVKSSNPLVKLALFVYRKQIRELISQPINLVDGLPKEHSLEDVSLRMRGRRLIATGRIV